MDWKSQKNFPIGKLYPERTDSWEISLDATLFKDFKLSGSFYYANTYNQTFDPEDVYKRQSLNNAGAYISQELGYALAWGNEYMNQLTEAGIPACLLYTSRCV